MWAGRRTSGITFAWRRRLNCGQIWVNLPLRVRDGTTVLRGWANMGKGNKNVHMFLSNLKLNYKFELRRDRMVISRITAWLSFIEAYWRHRTSAWHETVSVIKYHSYIQICLLEQKYAYSRMCLQIWKRRAANSQISWIDLQKFRIN